MTSNFFINRVFEENIEGSFTSNDAIFGTPGDSIELIHLPAIQNINSLSTWEHDVTVDINNYFDIEIAWSFDNINFTPYITLTNDFNSFPVNNTNKNTWLKIKYTYVNLDPNELNEITFREFNFTGIRTIDKIFEPMNIEPNKPTIFTNEDTYKVFQLEDFKLYLQSGDESDLEIHFRFTQTQGRRWSEWTPLTTENLKATHIERLKFCNFEFAFNNVGSSIVSLYDMELIGDFQNVTADYKTIARFGLKTQCNPLLSNDSPTGPCLDDNGDCGDCVPCSESITPWNADIDSCEFKRNNNFTQFNDKDLFKQQIQLYEQLNNFAEASNSWNVTYFLTDPDQKGIDHVLHEQQIHNIIAMRDVRVLVPNNQFPTGIMDFNNLDLDLLQSFEVHILKESFKRVFGVEFRPSQKDVLYMCDMNQLWEVEMMFPHRGFMLAETYYRVKLKKYSDRASRKYANTQEGQDAKDLISTLTKHTTLDNLFDIDVNNEIPAVTKDEKIMVDNNNQSQQYTGLSVIDIRSNIYNKAKIFGLTLWNSSVVVAKSMYEFPIKSKNKKLVEYTYQDSNVGLADNRAISMWFKTEDYDPSWEYTLFSNYDEQLALGYKLVLKSNILTFTFNNQVHQMITTGLQKEKWYSILVNVDQIQQEIEMAMYTRQSENGRTLANSKLLLFQKYKQPFTPQEFTNDVVMHLGGSDTLSSTGNRTKWFLTNIRVYKQVMGKERHIVLNENVLSDSNLSILVDNAEEYIDLPNYGNI